MKKLIIALTVSTIALAGALHAADTKTAVTDKDKGSCCEKAACCDKTKASASGKSACSATPSKGIAMSPKATELASH